MCPRLNPSQAGQYLIYIPTPTEGWKAELNCVIIGRVEKFPIGVPN